MRFGEALKKALGWALRGRRCGCVLMISQGGTRASYKTMEMSRRARNITLRL
jgi:hypothetical protein